ncbi:hypothetical protein [Micromonospora tarensis]|uniref:Uncharacterized protein n=1 Tax=Micromonospora tarensis TaxID=2806100 RepID=A0ABS1YCP9_9ACTN|nr:hypothetical protein [Micromonospora tarensis]MBM0275069.1 hypothetical protein [Micromonospora tarensis]
MNETPTMDITGGPLATVDPPRRHAEYGYVILCVTAIVLAATLFLVDHLAPVTIPFGTYPLLASVIGVGGCGWTVTWLLSRAERCVTCHVSAEVTEVREEVSQLSGRVAELAVQVEALLVTIAGQRDVGIRLVRPAARQVSGGHMYVAGTQGDTIGFRRGGSVDGPTDPLGVALGKPREDGRRNRSEGVTWLPEPETLRAARSLASRVIATEQHRAEDNSEDTGGMRI